jgi:hypothetical protein
MDLELPGFAALFGPRREASHEAVRQPQCLLGKRRVLERICLNGRRTGTAGFQIGYVTRCTFVDKQVD